jgi:competence protein ComEA
VVRNVSEEAMIDLNTATAEELDAIPQLKGHGFEIVRYRGERGRFNELRQLDEVPGLVGKWDGAEAEIGID